MTHVEAFTKRCAGSIITAFIRAILLVAFLVAPAIATAQVATPAPIPEPVASTPVGAQLAWVLDVLNDGARPLTPDAIATHFAPAFLGEVPPEQAILLTRQVATAGPFTVQGFTRPATATQANALLIGSTGPPLVVPIAVELTAPHRITGLNFAPVPPPAGTSLETIPSEDLVLADSATPATNAERFDGLIDIGGRRLYLSCSGSGSPTVVLESGHGDPAAPWFAVEQAAAEFTRVCSYDRANALASASDPAPTPRTGEDVVADLHALLMAADVPGPYVLVGHSLGGLYARLYASGFPDDVAGLVLVDSTHEDQFGRLKALVPAAVWAEFEAMLAQFPDPEGTDIETTAAEARAARAETPLAPMPLVVVTAGQRGDAALLPPGWPVEAEAALWQELQEDLAGLVPNGRHIVAEQSGHYVHRSQPNVVVDAIRQVVEAVRDPSRWGTPEALPAPAPSA
jgi:pimeloyl-ACP methyl ester carboxylesterase